MNCQYYDMRDTRCYAQKNKPLCDLKNGRCSAHSDPEWHLNSYPMDKRTEVMRDIIRLQIEMHHVMNNMIANSMYFDCDTMNNWSKSITECDKAISSLDNYIERINGNG